MSAIDLTAIVETWEQQATGFTDAAFRHRALGDADMAEQDYLAAMGHMSDASVALRTATTLANCALELRALIAGA